MTGDLALSSSGLGAQYILAGIWLAMGMGNGLLHRSGAPFAMASNFFFFFGCVTLRYVALRLILLHEIEIIRIQKQ